MKYLTSASLLSCDICNIENEIRRAENAGVDMIHFDAMDGRFVEQITFGSHVLKQIRKITNKTLDVHLMVEDPTDQIKLFAEAGADIITIHTESHCNIPEVLKSIRGYGKKASAAIKPATPVETVYDLLELCDMILVMTVEPGYGGQRFIPETMMKIRALRKHLNDIGYGKRVNIEVDGGVNAATAAMAKDAGANIFVSGSALFGSDDMKKANELLKSI